MKLLVTGLNGQVVSCLRERSISDPVVSVVPVGRPELDLASPFQDFHKILNEIGPDILVSAAAYTAVDKAEDEADLAFQVNAVAAGELAKIATQHDIPIIHLSTDYVFRGDLNGALDENAATGPRSVYGASKLAGELAVGQANPKHVILRSAWVYSPFSSNFVKTILRLANQKSELRIVADQWGSPTSAYDIADGIIFAAKSIQASRGASQWGVFHLAGAGSINWSGFARRILEISKQHNGPSAIVHDIATSEYPTKAVRPANSVLSSKKFNAQFGWAPGPWETAVEQVIQRLL